MISSIKKVSSIFVFCLLVLTIIQGCSSYSPRGAPPIQGKKALNKSIMFVGDPQIHNIYGFQLKQMSKLSDVVSKFTIRPPELNILAPLVLEYLIQQGAKNHKSNLIVVVGDTINIACSGEYASFLDALNRGNRGRLPILMAHGNHDSYLLGTVNHYLPTDKVHDWKPRKMQTSKLPTDESWWGGSNKVSSTGNISWRGACLKPSLGQKTLSSPMNKSRWLAKYIDMLKKSGATIQTRNNNSQPDGEVIAMNFASKPGSPLVKLNFKAKGLWYPPKLRRTPSRSNLLRTYKSFIVQKIDYDNSRVIIIDTSVCEKTRSFLGYVATNTGINACIGDPQFKIIEEYASRLPKNHKLVLVGHFPMGDIAKKERQRLLNILSAHKHWVYMSAHEHSVTSQANWKTGVEINIGSTTDWPMEVNNIRFRQGESAPRVYQTQNSVNKIPTYLPSHYEGATEICRHIKTAKTLALLNYFGEMRYWRSPKADPGCYASDHKSWSKLGHELAAYIKTIHQRFRSDEKYRNAVLAVAISASQSEALQGDLIGSFRLAQDR